jgi:hypothetical protein
MKLRARLDHQSSVAALPPIGLRTISHIVQHWRSARSLFGILLTVGAIAGALVSLRDVHGANAHIRTLNSRLAASQVKVGRLSSQVNQLMATRTANERYLLTVWALCRGYRFLRGHQYDRATDYSITFGRFLAGYCDKAMIPTKQPFAVPRG